MTKKELLENEEFKRAPMDAQIQIPNWNYEDNVDERQDVTPTEIRYWGPDINVINLWS